MKIMNIYLIVFSKPRVGRRFKFVQASSESFAIRKFELLEPTALLISCRFNSDGEFITC